MKQAQDHVKRAFFVLLQPLFLLLSFVLVVILDYVFFRGAPTFGEFCGRFARTMRMQL